MMNLIPEADYRDACDAVREKDGSSELIKSGELGPKIRAIPSGGGFEIADGAGAHNAIYRGKQFIGKPTEEQYAAIADGTFRDLFIGDYWTIDGVNYRIAAFDYFLNVPMQGYISAEKHHALIVPDTSPVSESYKTGGDMSKGYLTYDADLTRNCSILVSQKFQVVLFKHRISTSVSQNVVGSYGTITSTVSPMTINMVTGCNIGRVKGDNYYETVQLPLFQKRPDLIFVNKKSYWLMNVASDKALLYMDGVSGCAMSRTSASFADIRPYFLIG